MGAKLAGWLTPLPGWCLLCDDAGPPGFDLCTACRGALPWNGPACRGCALPLPAASPHDLCGICLARPAPFTCCVAPLRYELPASAMIRRLKYARSLTDGRVLSTLLAEQVADRYAGACLPELLVPVPLHWRRLLLRGQNQAAVIARHLGAQLGIPVAYRLCTRRRATRAQTGLSRAARQRNLANAFALRAAPGASRIALVDDVMTTGATLRALARCLGHDGAEEIHAWVVARTA